MTLTAGALAVVVTVGVLAFFSAPRELHIHRYFDVALGGVWNERECSGRHTTVFAVIATTMAGFLVGGLVTPAVASLADGPPLTTGRELARCENLVDEDLASQLPPVPQVQALWPEAQLLEFTGRRPYFAVDPPRSPSAARHFIVADRFAVLVVASEGELRWLGAERYGVYEETGSVGDGISGYRVTPPAGGPTLRDGLRAEWIDTTGREWAAVIESERPDGTPTAELATGDRSLFEAFVAELRARS